MSSYTDKLDLFKYNTTTDASDLFNIDLALNDNWDKLDSKVAITNYDSETSYSYGDVVLSTESDNVTLYRSIKDNNQGNPLTDVASWEEVQLSGNGNSSSRNIGEIVSSSLPLIDAGLHLLDGSLIRGGGVYDDFVNYIAEKYEEDPTADYFMQPQTQTNVTKVGNIIEENGILSGFTSDSYAMLPETFNPGSNTWERVIKFTTGNSIPTDSQVIWGNNGDYIGFQFWINSTELKFHISAGDTGTAPWSYFSQAGTHTVQTNTTYYVRTRFTGTAYTLEYSTDGLNYTTDITVNDSTPVPSTTIVLGTHTVGAPFLGSIDLKESYININGQRWWNGIVGSTQTTYNVQTVGSLVNTDGILSNFSITSYAMLPEAFNPGNNTWEIRFAFTTGNDVNTFQMLIADEHSYSGLELILQNSHFTLQSLRNDAHTAIFSETGTYTVLSNTTYFIKIRFTGSAYTLDYSLDGVSYINDITANSSETIDPLNLPLLGIDVAAPDDAKASPFLGSINLAGCYIDINSTCWWSGTSTIILPTLSAEEAWQAHVDEYGVCGKFVYDPEANTVRLPRIIGFTESVVDKLELGDFTEAGLPNITGNFGGVDPSSIINGAFYYDGVQGSTQSVTGNDDPIIWFDASRSSSIYGNSNTVQPQSIKVLYYICIATSKKTDIEVDIDKIITDLNNIKDGAHNSLFDVIPKDHILSFEESKGLARLGTYVYKEAVLGARYGYKDFYNKCIEEYTAEGNRRRYILNADVVGNLINNEGVVSGFGSSSWATGGIFSPSSDWEINLKFTHGTSSVLQCILDTTTEYQSIGFEITPSNTLLFESYINGTSSSLFRIFSTTTLNTNTTYWVKLIYSSTSGYTLKLSTDGVTYTIEGTSAVTTPITAGQTLLFGVDNLGGVLGGDPFLGSIDFNESYIKINDQLWWTGANLVLANVNGHMFYDINDKSWVDDLYNRRGEAWFYGIDTENERIYLPRSTRIKFGGTEEVGDYQEAGLPNITGNVIFKGQPGATASGAFQFTASGQTGSADNYSGEHQASFDASRSSTIYGNSNTVEYSSTKMIPYMVVGNVLNLDASTDIVDVTTTENDTLPLFTGMYFDVRPNNASWILAGGQVASGDIYTFAYNELINELLTPKYGLQVIEEDDMVVGVDYSTYWKVNQDQQYFIAPNKLSYEALTGGVHGNGMSLGLTNGSSEGSFGTKDGWGNGDPRYYQTVFREGLQNKTVGTDNGLGFTSWFSTATGVSQNVANSGLIAEQSTTAKLYFKVANAVQNLELLDAGEVLEAVNDLIPDNSSLIAHYAMPSDTYVNLILGASGTSYTAPADGYYCLHSSAANSNLELYLGTSTDFTLHTTSNNNGVGWYGVYLPVKKGDTITAYYSGTTPDIWRFTYARGSENSNL